MWHDDFARRWAHDNGFCTHWADVIVRRAATAETAGDARLDGTMIQQVRRGFYNDRRTVSPSDITRLGERRGLDSATALRRRQGLFQSPLLRSRLAGGYEPEWCQA